MKMMMLGRNGIQRCGYGINQKRGCDEGMTREREATDAENIANIDPQEAWCDASGSGHSALAAAEDDDADQGHEAAHRNIQAHFLARKERDDRSKHDRYLGQEAATRRLGEEQADVEEALGAKIPGSKLDGCDPEGIVARLGKSPPLLLGPAGDNGGDETCSSEDAAAKAECRSLPTRREMSR